MNEQEQVALQDFAPVPTGMIRVVIRDGKTGKIKSDDLIKNTFTEAGKVSLAAAIRGVTANNQGEITYCALGTSAIAPDPNDTDLVAEIARKPVSVRSSTGKVATFLTFYTTAEGNGTLREAGLFGDDASTIPGSGTLFARGAINRTKSASDTLTLSWSVTIG